MTGAGAVSGTGPEGAGDAALALLSLSGGELGAISAGVGAGVGALEGADEAARVREVASPWIRWKIAVTAGRT